MLLEDVFQILPLLMPKTFVDQFVFVWGHEQCTTIRNQLTHSIYYYLKDLDQVHFTCKGLPYGDRDQTLFIDDELSKALRNLKWNGLFLEPLRGCELFKNKVQWLNLASRLWPTLKGFPLAKTIYGHSIVIMQFSRSLFSS
jgi:hypothetical protein